MVSWEWTRNAKLVFAGSCDGSDGEEEEGVGLGPGRSCEPSLL